MYVSELGIDFELRSEDLVEVEDGEFEVCSDALRDDDFDDLGDTEFDFGYRPFSILAKWQAGLPDSFPMNAA